MTSPLRLLPAAMLLLCAAAPSLTAPPPVEQPEGDPAHAAEVEYYNNQGALLAGRGRYREAVQAFRRAVRLAPDFAVGHYNLGLAHSRLEVFSEAIAAFETAVLIRPDYADAWYQLGLAFQAERHFEAAVRAYREAQRLGRDGPEVRYRLGAVSVSLEDWAQAVAHWESFLSGYPEHTAASEVRKNLPGACYNLGTVHQRAGRLSEAAAAYGRALQMQPDYVEALYNLGLVRRNQERLNEAASALQQALRLRPNGPDILTTLGGVYVLQNRLDDALELFQKALKLRDDRMEARYGLADLYLRRGDVERALREALLVATQAPDDPKNHALLAYIYEHNPGGKRYGAGYRAREAIRAYRKALRLRPDDVSYRYNLGVIYGRTGNWSQARLEFQRVLAIDSTHAGARKWLPQVEAEYRAEQQSKVQSPETVPGP